jgi:proteic killer suppression protein
VRKLDGWIRAVELSGLEMVRRLPGSHDEPLKGPRAGQRSIRLSQSYRAIYVLDEENQVKFVRIEEVSKHGY